MPLININPHQGRYVASVRYIQPRITLSLYRRTVCLDTLDDPADLDPSPCLGVQDVTLAHIIAVWMFTS
jgi:hypothetical protein